jgi:NAD-dependent deacetylase
MQPPEGPANTPAAAAGRGRCRHPGDGRMNDSTQLVASILRTARQVVVLSGAGISRDSGLPTFREAQTGLWARFRPEELATPEAFVRQPGLVWAWYAWRRRLVADALPNAGHRALAAMEQRLRREGKRFTLVTQNVDGLHQRAGSDDVVELHGSIRRIVCSGCRREAAEPPAEASSTASSTLPSPEAVDDPPDPPACPHCHAFLRPDVVWFGELLPEAALGRAAEEAAGCDLFLSVGTSGLVYPAAGLVQVAQRGGARVVVVNPADDVVPGALRLQGSASSLLPELVAAAWPQPS